ncbi:MAG: PEP-utilizing enzyme [Sporichthyaceae bacterium]
MTPPVHDPVRGYSDPDRLWTTTNVAEATPDILTPLCWSVFGDGLEQAWLDSMGAFGVLGAAERVRSDDPNRRAVAAILGRQAVNIAVLRQVVARLPGVSPDDVERDIFGSVRPGVPTEPGAPRRIPVILVKFPLAMLGIDRRIHAMYDEQLQWWRRSVLDTPAGLRRTPEEAMARLSEGYDRFAAAMALHARSRFLLSAAEKPVVDAFSRAGRPELARELLSAYDGVAETAMADALWNVAHDRLTLTQFLRDYGFHGPNEGNVYTRSWREEPQRTTSLAEAYRNRPDLRRPRDQEAEAMRTRAARQGELLALLPARSRPAVKFARARAAGMTRKLELGKAAFLMALDGCRAAARELGAALAESRVLCDPEDVFFLTVPELAALVAGGCGEARALVSHRREQREYYRRISMPRTWTGFPDLDELSTLADIAASDDPPTPIRGVAWGGGQVTGRARVVRDAHDDVELDEGDILVCRFTDPSWAPLFSMADALVIDIGGPQSHGAVVARELGVPYVIGTENGTDVIREGDVLSVDGATGNVTVLSRPTPA